MGGGGLRVAPVVLAEQGRVALGDEIGAALEAALVVVLIGERPGLSASDSLGIYLTHSPAPGCVDAMRNCISNVRPGGLQIDVASRMAAQVATAARQQGLTGTGLDLSGIGFSLASASDTTSSIAGSASDKATATAGSAEIDTDPGPAALPPTRPWKDRTDGPG